MKVPWLLIALGVSVLANVCLAVAWFGQTLSEGVLEADTQSTFRSMTAERAQLQALRVRFCPGEPAPHRSAILAWDAEVRPDQHSFEKDGLLWLGAGSDLGVRFDVSDRLVGVCLAQTWGALEGPSLAERDRAGELCPLEPLC